MPKRITRSTVNEQQYSAEVFPKSGFNLTHRRYASYILGRLQVSGHQDVMPGDKIAGKNDGTFTFNNIVTPMIPKVDVQQYNFLQPDRAVDRSFEKAFAPSKNNNMSASWSAPSISTQTIVRFLFEKYIEPMSEAFTELFNTLVVNGTTARTSVVTLADTFDDVQFALYGSTNLPNVSGIVSRLQLMFDNERMSSYESFKMCFKDLYLDDVLADIRQRIDAVLGTRTNPVSSSTSVNEFFYNFLDCFLTPFVGRYSYYADFHYNYVRPKDLYNLTSGVFGAIQTYENLILMFDATELNEYPIRHMYSIWYEYFRNVDLEPVSQTLPDWRDFASGSIVENNPAFLVYRPRPWYEDMFISAQIDDLSRHVWAPIVNNSSDQVAYHDDYINTLDANTQGIMAESSYGGQLKPSIYNIGWHDQVSGDHKSISCPVPTNINDILAATNNEFSDVYGLDLNSLRQAQQLERYLKRNYLFGDEYNDRMLAHYNSRVSDLRINRPELVSQSFNSSDNKQEIANMSNEVTNAGDRTATATISAGGDDYNVFCEEFGCLIHVITFMPTACYDGIHPQLLLSKVQDYPLPEFATNNEEFGRKIEIASTGLTISDDLLNMFGRYPAYHAWRQRVDEVGGMFLDELQDCIFRRFWGLTLDSEYSYPVLNYHFIHCRPNLQMFRNSIVYDSQIYGDIVHECYVERVLPTPVEKI